MNSLIRGICILAMTMLGLISCSNDRPGGKDESPSLPWNMSEQQLDLFSKELATMAIQGNERCLWDIVQAGRIEDGARSEILGEAIGLIYDGWGTGKLARIVASYPSYAQDATVGYLLVARGNDVAQVVRAAIKSVDSSPR